MYNVLIRPLELGDARVSWSWRNDPDVWKYTGSRPDRVVTYEIEKQWLEKILLDETSSRFAILVDNIYVGNIQLTNIEDSKAEYHIFIGEKFYWGKGIAVLATWQIIRYAKYVLNLEEIYLSVNPENVGAIKVYEKCNFIKTDEKITMKLNLKQDLIPLVSVFMMVYNHEQYLHQALDGILMQKTNFDFEIVVGEDASKDASRKILLDYMSKYPGKFKLLLHKQNIGAYKNQELTFNSCVGKYVAICEGDDYWTDSFKLEKQVDFLQNHPEYSFCTHRYKVFSEINKVFLDEIHPSNLKLDKNLKGEIINKINFHEDWITQPLTALIRNDALQEVLKEGKRFEYFRDFHLFYLLLNYGNGICFDFIGGIYRRHDGGVHSGIEEKERLFKALSIYEELYLYSKDKFFLKTYSRISIILMKRGMEKISFNKNILSKLSLKHKIYFIVSFIRSAYSLAKQKYIN